MKPEEIFDGLPGIDLHAEYKADDEQLEKLENQLEVAIHLASTDGTFADGRVIEYLKKEISALREKIDDREPLTQCYEDPIDTIEQINADFDALFEELRAKGEIQGSSRKYSAEDLIGIISSTRDYLKSGKGIPQGLSQITNTDKIRERVRALIEREKKLNN
jgi:hypothetical protein